MNLYSLYGKFVVFSCSLLLVFPCPAQAQNNPPEVTNVSAVIDTQNSIVLLNYDLLDSEQDTMQVILKASSDNGQTFIFPVDSVAGDVGYPVISGTQKQIIWHYDPQIVNFSTSSTNRFRAKIVADDLYEVDIQELVEQVDGLNLKNDLAFVEGIRYPFTAHLEATKDFIENRFRSNNLQVHRHEFSYGAYNAANIIGRLPGQTQEEITYIIDGHFDTVSNSPGADDNGSGTVGMLEAMRVLSAYNFAHTIKFIGFDLEEFGLVGSERYVKEAIPPYEQIEGVFNLEMIGYFCPQPNCQTVPSGWDNLFPALYDSIAAHNFKGDFILNLANENSNPIKTAYDSCAAAFVPELRVLSLAVPGNGAIARDSRRSDHARFWDAGYKALMLVDFGPFRNPNYHGPEDVSRTLNFTFMTNVVKATVATVAKLADIQHSGVGVSNLFDIPVTSISYSPQAKPDKFYLAQNYPNPFNPVTIINYELPLTSDVELTIYNQLGQRVKTLVNERQPAGVYQVQWDGRSQEGVQLSSGVYIYRIKAGDFVDAKKLALIR